MKINWRQNLMILLCLIVGATELTAAERSYKLVLFPFREAVISARVDSTLLPYRFKIGEKFAEGAVLVSLAADKYTLELARLQAQYDFSKATFLDKKELRAKDFTSDFELKKSEYDCAQAATALQEARLNYSYCTIKSPFAGKIVELLTREYETVRPGQPVLRIIDDHALLAVVNIALSDLQNLAENTPVKLTVDTLPSALELPGRIYEISPQADHRTGTVRVRILLDNADGKLRPGVTGSISSTQLHEAGK